jgi:hypothetical protein
MTVIKGKAKMSQESANLLLEAIKDIEELVLPPESHFSMSFWGDCRILEGNPKENNYCGTSACALGWLTTMPKWQDRGIVGSWRRRAADGTWYLYPGESEYEGYSGDRDWEDMVVEVFKIIENDAEVIFISDLSYDREQFCKKVRRYVELRTEGMSSIEAHMKVRIENEDERRSEWRI